MSKGLFISFEGTDGSGKSTQIKYVQQFLATHDVPYLLTREPGGTVVGEKIRRILLDPKIVNMDSVTETLLYAASRSQNLQENILPGLDRGDLVLCDRFFDSSLVYQGAGRNLPGMVRRVDECIFPNRKPDRTYLIDLPPISAAERIRDRGQDRIEMENIEFYSLVYEGYRELAEDEPERFVVLDGRETRETIRDRIFDDLNQLLVEHNFL